MANVIPYTNDAFNIIANHSRCFYNNREIPNSKIKFHVTDNNINMMSPNSNGEFMQSLVSEIDMFIQSILYDVDIKQKTHNYICSLMNKYYKFLTRDAIKYMSQIDYKYSRFLGEHFVQDIFAQYLCDNVMINE